MGKRLTVQLSEARCDRIVELTRQGFTAHEIAGIVGIHRRSVHRARKTAGVAREWRRFTDADKARAADMLADGASVEEVARTLGRSSQTIHHHFPGHGWSRAQMNENVAMLQRGARLLS